MASNSPPVPPVPQPLSTINPPFQARSAFTSQPPPPQVFANYQDTDRYFNSLPPGYRFCPHDHELVMYYLDKKVKGLPLPMNRIVNVDIYQFDPEFLSGMVLFHTRSRKYRNGTRPNRAAGGGYWKATGADKAKITVGQRKALVYYNGKAPKGEKTNWIMHEFRLDDPPLHVRNNRDDMRLDDCVLCMIYKKRGKRTNADTTVRVQQSNEENSSLMTIEGNDEDFINEHGYDPNRLSAIEASFAGEIHGTITPLENSFPRIPDASNLYTLQASPIPGLEEAFGTPAPMDFFNSEDWFYTQMEQRDEFLMSPANSSQYYNIPDQFVNLYPTMPTNLLTNPSPLPSSHEYCSTHCPLRPANPASTHPTSEMMNVAPNHPGQPPQHR
ncbi:NAC domain-containing protein [Salix suchowensis]|nr:NAC domain-containing protein [Salix suchowensis]